MADRPRPARPREHARYFSGDAGALADILRGYAREGISHVQVVLDPNTTAGVEAFARVLEVLDRS